MLEKRMELSISDMIACEPTPNNSRWDIHAHLVASRDGQVDEL